MTRTEQIESLLSEALTLPGGERVAWVVSQCQTDSSLMQAVLSRLDKPAMSVIHRADAHSDLTQAMEMVEEAGPAAARTDRLGPYRLATLLGSGGMGAVYLAHREDGEFEQKVAIKVMGRHLADSVFLHSFRNERQVLAKLSHPNITRLLDGGVSELGEPYLVMEYIDGQPLDEYCKEHRLSADARLLLFQQVCQAVEYLHRNLIVHRDLKPGNILVDSGGTVKLLDFGTAKLLGDRAPVATQASMLTPQYASPEQLRAEPVTTASDVFSLGVILYELLTGAWPFGNPKSVADGLERAIKGRRASRPSDLITETAAEERSITRERLKRELTGDLSTILFKMLENEPAQRYGSARQVDEDIQRYREGRPILARPQTAWYAARKFVRRNWLGVSAATLAVLALAGLTIFSFIQSVKAREQAARAERVSNFAKNTFLSASSTWSSPLRGQSRAIQFTDILDNAAERVGKELGNDPAAEADLRGTLGMTYSVLGDPVKGEAQLLLAIQRLKQAQNPSPAIAIDIYVRLCDTESFQGHYVEALAACREALSLARRHGSTYGLGSILHDTAFMSLKAGAPFEEAEKLFRDALANPPPGAAARLHPALINTRIGALRLRQGDLAEGDRLLRGAEQLLRGEPGPPIEIIPTLVALAFGARVRGQYDEAIRLLQESINLLIQRPTPYMGRELIEIELGAAEALAGKPRALSRLGNFDAQLAAATAPSDLIRLEMLAGTVEARSGLGPSAERRFRDALATSESKAPRQSADRVEVYLRLAQLLAVSGREHEASEAARKGLEIAQLAYGAFFLQHPFVSELRKLSR